MTDRRSFLSALAAVPLARALPLRAPVEKAPLTLISSKPRMPAEIHATGEDFWKELRKECTLNRDETFFNTGTLGASPKAVQEAVIDHMRHVDRDIARWDYKADHENYFTGYYPELTYREKLAAIINAKGHDVALTQNATFGMNFLAN